MRQPKRRNNIRVIKDETNPETPEILASSIIKISEGFQMLMETKGGLNRDAIVALLAAMKGMREVSKGDITLVLDGLDRLRSYYVRK